MNRTTKAVGVGFGNTLREVVEHAHALWTQKRPFFLSSKLNWTPKYAEADVGITEYIHGEDGGAGMEAGIGGVVKALWSDFVVEEVRLLDGTIVELPAHSDDPGGDAYPLGRQRGDEARYLRFVLCLLGIDTISGVRKLADFCGAPYTAFRFAGIKDKYGITVQEVSVDTSIVDIDRVLAAGAPSSPLHASMRVGLGPVAGGRLCDGEHLHSGELAGNRFTIAVRNVTAHDRDILRALQGLRHHGSVHS